MVYFWARAKQADTRPQPEEVEIARFVPVEQAAKLLTYEADRRLLKKAEEQAKKG